MRVLLSALSLAVATVATAAPPEAAAPKLTGPAQVEPYKLVRVKVENAPVGHFVFLDVFPMDGVDIATQRVKSEFEFVAPPGTYKVRARLAKSPDLPPVDLWHTVVIGQPSPRPPPDPPVPPVPPAPAEKVAWVIVVDETSARTPDIARVLNDAAMWKRLDGRGIKYRLYDKDSPDAKNKKYPEFAAQVGLPAVLLLDAGGKVLRVVKLPATAAELEGLVK
jgi:hypothetical protein